MMKVAGATGPQDPASVEKIAVLMKKYLLSSTVSAIKNNISTRMKVNTPNNYIGPLTITPSTDDLLSSIFERIYSLRHNHHHHDEYHHNHNHDEYHHVNHYNLSNKNSNSNNNNKKFNIKLAQRFIKYLSWKMEKKSKACSGPLCGIGGNGGGGGIGEEEDLEVAFLLSANEASTTSDEMFIAQKVVVEEEEEILDDSIFTKDELEEYISMSDVPFSSIMLHMETNSNSSHGQPEQKRSHRKKNAILAHFGADAEVDEGGGLLGVAECTLSKVWHLMLLLSSVGDHLGAKKVEKLHHHFYCKLASLFSSDANEKENSISVSEAFDEAKVTSSLCSISPLCDLNDLQRLKRMDDVAKSLGKDEYVLWSEARQSNFTSSLKSKNGKKFREHLNLPALAEQYFTAIYGTPSAMTVRFTDDFYSALSHLGYEFVNLLVEFALDLQRTIRNTSPPSVGVCNIFNRHSDGTADFAHSAATGPLWPSSIANVH